MILLIPELFVDNNLDVYLLWTCTFSTPPPVQFLFHKWLFVTKVSVMPTGSY